MKLAFNTLLILAASLLCFLALEGLPCQSEYSESAAELAALAAVSARR